MSAIRISIFIIFISLFLVAALPAPTSLIKPVVPAVAVGVGPAIPTPSPTPTPRPLTLAEMNRLYGPCAVIPTLMYHHVQTAQEAKNSGYTGLNVTPEVFNSQLDYINSRGYSVISVSDLSGFFSNTKVLPNKPLLLTFDDGYEDFYLQALPLLVSHNFPATLFLPTGLADNPGYMSWSQISQLSSRHILVANHTWSHSSIAKEITTADIQLSDRGLNSPKTFAYPYGSKNSAAITELKSLGYTTAFTTRPGKILCAKTNLELPRIRIGNSPLNNFGL